MLTLKALLDKQLELITLINTQDLSQVTKFIKGNKENLLQILNTQHILTPESVDVEIWNPEGDSFHYSDVKSNTPLTAAIKLQKAQLVTLLFNEKADVNITEPQISIYTITMPWKTPLQIAFSLDNLDIATILVSRNMSKLDINTTDYEGKTVLHYILSYGEGNDVPYIVKSMTLLVNHDLLDADVEIALQDKPTSLLALACEVGNMSDVEAIARKAENLDIMVGEKTFWEFVLQSKNAYLISQCIAKNLVDISQGNIMVGEQTLFEFANQVHNNDIISRCIEQNVMKITPHTLQQGYTTLANTIRVAQGIYKTILPHYYTNAYEDFSYLHFASSGEHFSENTGGIIPTLLLNIQINDKPLYEYLAENPSFPSCDYIFQKLNIFYYNPGNVSLFSNTIKYIVENNNIAFCQKLSKLIPSKLCLEEAINTCNFNFAKQINPTITQHTTQTLATLMEKVVTDDNLPDVIEVMLLYSNDCLPWQLKGISKFDNFMKFSRSFGDDTQWIKNIKQYTDPEQQARLATASLKARLMNHNLSQDLINPLIQLGANVNEKMPFSDLSIAETALDYPSIAMLMLATGKVNITNNLSLSSSITNDEYYGIISRLPCYAENHSNVPLISDNLYKQYPINLFLNQINGESLFLSILKDSTIDHAIKENFLNHAYANNIHITEADLSATSPYSIPRLFELMTDQNVRYEDKAAFLNYIQSKNIDVKQITDHKGNNLLHILASDARFMNETQKIELIDLLKTHGLSSSESNNLDQSSIDMRFYLHAHNPVTIALKSISTQTNIPDSMDKNIQTEHLSEEDIAILGLNYESSC